MTEPAPEVPVDPDGLVVSTAALAKRARIEVTADNHDVLVEAIQDAQDDVVAYLGRAIVPTLYTEHGVGEGPGGTFDLTPLDEPVRSITTIEPELYTDGLTPTGLYTVTYLAGLDAANDPELRPIVRFVRAHALNSPEITRLWQEAGGKGEVRAVSAEGQSISYGPATLGGGGEAGSEVPGALPTKASLDRWRVAGRRVSKRRDTYHGNWPYVSLDPNRGARWPY